MSERPLDQPFTPREVVLGERVATALWLLSVTLMGLLVVWSLGPHRVL